MVFKDTWFTNFFKCFILVTWVHGDDIDDILSLDGFGSSANGDHETANGDHENIEIDYSIEINNNDPEEEAKTTTISSSTTESTTTSSTTSTTTVTTTTTESTTTFIQDLREPIEESNVNGEGRVDVPEKAFTPVIIDDTLEDSNGASGKCS